MKFGPVPVGQAEGAVLAHAAIAGKRRFRKGAVIGPDEIAAFRDAGIETVIVATLAENDLGENEAARRLADAFGGNNINARRPSTGRVNLHAARAGVFTVDSQTIARFNAVDPAITVATLANFTTVAEGQMVATVKIIPFAVDGALVEKAASIPDSKSTLAVHGFRPHRAGLVQSVLPSVKPKTLDKTRRVTQERLERSGSVLAGEMRVAHNEEEIAKAISSLIGECDAVFIFGASAVCDREDVVPVAIEKAGGRVIHFGMPVDPGNLLVLGEAFGKPVIGAPGCARSSKENGFDWVIDRLFAGLDVSGRDLTAMGVGGLLTEIASRPQPREPENQAARMGARVEAVVLAAGRSTRMGGANKLLAKFGDEPLIRKVTQAVQASGAARVVVVTGHQAERIEAAISDLGAAHVHNPDYAEGMATSLVSGIGTLSGDTSGALIMLGDMPGVQADDLDRMIAAFRQHGGAAIVRATHSGKRGNPVIIPRPMFSAVKQLHGDTGARHLIESNEYPVVDVEIGPAASVDIDTPQALEMAGGVIENTNT